MTRAVRLICCVALLWCHTLPLSAQQFRAQESNPGSVTATIEAVDTTNRTVTVKRTDGTSAEIKAPKEMQGFNTLKVGDRVTATYYEVVL